VPKVLYVLVPCLYDLKNCHRVASDSQTLPWASRWDNSSVT